MDNSIEMVREAVLIVENPDNCSIEEDEDGNPAFALRGKAIDASMLLYIFQEGIRDGYIHATIDDSWPRLNYWYKLVKAIQ